MYPVISEYMRPISQTHTTYNILQGVFLPVFKKLKAAFKKTQANFWQKTQLYGGNFGYQEKNSIFLTKYPEFIQKFFGFSINLQNFPSIKAIFVEFSQQTMIFSEKIFKFLKNSRSFPKKLKDLKKTSEFWSQCASG